MCCVAKFEVRPWMNFATNFADFYYHRSFSTFTKALLMQMISSTLDRHLELARAIITIAAGRRQLAR